MPRPRLRMFAGPNGSGKSTIKEQIPSNLIGTYVNADEIEKTVKASGLLDLDAFGVCATSDELHAFFAGHSLILKFGLQDQALRIELDNQSVDFRAIEMSSYYASVIADFIRHKLLENKTSFTFETVMSSSDKVDFLRLAQAKGYRTYLYFVATESPEININRVANRVGDGGHNVPQEKIIKRYYRSLELLPEAIAASNRAFIFDNSGEQAIFMAEVTDGSTLDFHHDEIPDWFMNAYVDNVLGG
ncbi:zeta toxin family protein [Pseudomonas capsici]|uniref:zeta toxin family protein n=1 Tax=Pseudomonas capsici TaxID=2810614 RepID=UPI0021F1252B|nr:zeta toxin family protein [Pseudomonas capsici]MCV4342260.1 zeta toxin family protein [Pseudomonas capsici]